MAFDIMALYKKAGDSLRGFSGQLQGNKGFGSKVQRMGGGGPREIQNKYRDEYGFRLTNQGYDKLKKERSNLDKQIDTYRTDADSQISDAWGVHKEQKDALEAAIKDNQGKLDAAKKALGSAPDINDMFNKWYNQDTVNVRVVNEKTGQIEAVVKAPRSVVANFDSKGDKGHAAFVDGGKNYNISTSQPKGYGGGTYAHKVALALSNKDELRKQFVTNPEVQKGFSSSINQWRAAEGQVSAAQAALNSTIAEKEGLLRKQETSIKGFETQRDTKIGNVNAQWQGQLDAAKGNYEKTSAKAKKAYGALKGMGRTNE